MTRVLITGGAGYIGSVLCEHLLNKNYQVTVLDSLIYKDHNLFHFCNNKNFNFVFGDCRDEKVLKNLLKDQDVIIPLAAIVGAPACDRDPLLTTSVNKDAIFLINKLRSKNQLIIYPNTNSGYGCKSAETYCTEDTPLEPISLYGTTKTDAELEILNSPNSLTLRLATVFGTSPRMRLDLLVNTFVHAAVTEGCITIFEKDFKRNFVHVRDVADCFLHCIENSQKMLGRPYNLGLDSANLSKEELALKVKEFVSSFYIHFAEYGTDPDKRNYIVSSNRLKLAGFEAKRGLNEGIPELIKAYRMIKRLPMRNI